MAIGFEMGGRPWARKTNSLLGRHPMGDRPLDAIGLSPPAEYPAFLPMG